MSDAARLHAAGSDLRLVPGATVPMRALGEAVERINRSEIDRSGILLRTLVWEHDVVPRIGLPPQTVIDEQPPLCDLYVGILSARFGGNGTRESGTEQGFRQALAWFGDTGKPWVLFFTSTNSHRSGHSRPRRARVRESARLSRGPGDEVKTDRASS